MYTLISGCYKQLMERREFGVLMVGLEAAGKTTLLERLKTLYDLPTLSFSFCLLSSKT